MLKMFIDNEEVVSNKEFTITEEMLATSSTILNNCYPKNWEDTKNYVNNFYFPKDYSKCKIESGDFLYGNMPIAELNISGNNLNFITNITDRFKQFQIDGKSTQETNGAMPSPDYPSKIKNIEGVRNLLNWNDIYYGNNVIATYSNQEVEFSWTGGFNLYLLNNNNRNIQLSKDKTYILSFEYKGTGITLRDGITLTNFISIGATDEFRKYCYIFTDYEKIQLNIIRKYSSEGSAIIKNVQIEEGTQAHDYVPYGNWLQIKQTGKNLFNIENKKSITTYEKIINQSIPVGTYHLTASSITSNSTKFVTSLITFRSNGEQIAQTYIGGTQPLDRLISLNKKCDEIYLYANSYYNNSVNVTTTFSDLMISTDGEEYEAYKEKITNIGLNMELFDKNNVEDGKIVVRTTGELTSNTSYYATDYIEVESNTKYTEYGFNVWYTACYDENKTYISNVDNSTTFTTPENAKYIRMSLLKTNINIARLQKGGKIVDTELCSIGEVKDELIIKDGKAKINKRFGKIVLNGRENWQLSSYTNDTIYSVYAVISNYSYGLLISDLFAYQNDVSATTTTEYVATGGNSIRIGILKSRLNASTINDFKSWLSTHNTTVYYELAEPYEVDLGDYNIELFDGVNNISLDSDIETNLSLDYYYKNYDLLFCGFVKNSGNISLNPRYPHYCSLEILDYKAMLSEGDTLDFVLSNITIGEAIELIIDKIKDYGFIVGNINIFNKNEVIGAYSTLNKTPYDVFQYLADISGSKWFTRVIDEYTIAIDFYDPTLMPKKANIDYTENYFEENNIIDISFSFSSRDYRNKQIMLSDQVIGNIDYTENILANGYDTNYLLQSNIAVLKKVLVNGISKTIATEEEKNIGIEADFYYTIGSNTFETAETYSSNTNIQIIYTPLVKGRETIINDDEIKRIQQYGRKGVIARYENRNDALSSLELQRIGQSYIKYKGNSEVSLVIKTKDKSLYNIGDVVYFNAPIDDLKQEYMVKKKETKIITTNGYNNVFYIFELSSSFNSEKEINWFDNQRNKANGNIQSGEYIDRNIDIDNEALIIFDNLQIKEVEVENTNTLDCVLESPFIN